MMDASPETVIRVRRQYLSGDAVLVQTHNMAMQVMRETEALGREDMPPRAELVALLLDAMAFRWGLRSRGASWEFIGVSPANGRGFLGRHRDKLPFPVVHTLRDLAMTARPFLL